MGASVVEALHQVVEEVLAAGEDALEGDLLRDDAVVEEEGDRAPRRQPAEVSPRRVDPPAGDIFPPLLRGQRTEIRRQTRPALVQTLVLRDLTSDLCTEGSNAAGLARGAGRAARASSEAMSAAVSGSHMPSASRPKRWRKSARPQRTCVRLSRSGASGRMT